MNSHYFTNDNPNIDKIYNFTYYYKEHLLRFNSSPGVFSKTQVDFGTHTLLNALDIKNTVRNVLDLGCGIGVIGLSLAKVYPKLIVDMVDVNLKAIKLANLNKEENKIDNITLFESDLYTNVVNKYDLIVSNPPIRAGKKIVHGVVDGAFSSLNANGNLWIVIQKKQGAPSMIKKMEEVFGNCQIIEKEKGYWILMSEKR